MRDSLGAPLEYVQAKRGYRYLADFVLPTYFVGDRDREILWQLSDYYDGLAEIGYEHYEGYAELLERLSGGKPRLSAVKARPTVPYRATIDFGEGRSYFRLLQRYCVKEPESGRAVYEFDRPEIFLGLLFATGAQFRIVEPVWLREKFREHARMVLARNNEDAT